MPDDPEPLDHRSLAVVLFNRTWELLDQESRSQQDNADMLTAAFTSRYHWLQVGEPRNFTVSDWQVSRVAAVLGHADLAAEYGQWSLDVAVSADLGPFYTGYAHEALARAAALAGNRELKNEHLEAAFELLADVREPSERDLLAPDLDELRG